MDVVSRRQGQLLLGGGGLGQGWPGLGWMAPPLLVSLPLPPPAHSNPTCSEPILGPGLHQEEAWAIPARSAEPFWAQLSKVVGSSSDGRGGYGRVQLK